MCAKKAPPVKTVTLNLTSWRTEDIERMGGENAFAQGALDDWTLYEVVFSGLGANFYGGQAAKLYAVGIDGIPSEHLEAARIDGATWFQETRHIVRPALMPIVGMVTLLIFVGDFTQFDIVYSMTTTMANPRYTTDLFGSLFYRAAFYTPVRGGWEMGMGAAVSTIMVFVVSIGVGIWYYAFKGSRKGEV